MISATTWAALVSGKDIGQRLEWYIQLGATQSGDLGPLSLPNAHNTRSHLFDNQCTTLGTLEALVPTAHA